MRDTGKKEIEGSKTISLDEFLAKLFGKIGTKRRRINDARIKIVENEMIEEVLSKSASL